jgi:nucleoside-diphosphate-sugar epimerase
MTIPSDPQVPVRSVVEKLVELLDPTATPYFGSVNERPFEQIRVANMSQTRRAVGWAPQINLLDGLKRTVMWYSEQLTGEPSPPDGESSEAIIFTALSL